MLIEGLNGGDKLKVYKDQSSSYIRCDEIELNTEYIHILQQDETIGDGIFRERFASGNSAIGSQYFSRSGREEEWIYCLYRFNESGNIYYYDKILDKDVGVWRTLAKYIFDSKTLRWHIT